jgi:3-oxoacyl-[acyl-carrier-protein] synthase I
MSAAAAAVLATGIVSSVGMTAAATCAAVRTKVANPSPTAFVDSAGKPIMAHQVSLDRPWRGVPRLARMAALATQEALAAVTPTQRQAIPLLLCVAERERPGRTHGLDDALFPEVQRLVGCAFSDASRVFARGKVGVAEAIARARAIIAADSAAHVLILAVDSLLTGGTLEHLARRDRLLTEENSNGFMPGEAAGAILVGAAPPGAGCLRCLGLGFGVERAHVDSEEPLRGDGLAFAIKAALADAAADLREVACRIADVSGEQYYFKEATLALSRTLRQRRENLELWHPAESVGEVGAAAGVICVAVASAAAGKHYLPPGQTVLLHFADDQGNRAALVAGWEH